MIERAGKSFDKAFKVRLTGLFYGLMLILPLIGACDRGNSLIKTETAKNLENGESDTGKPQKKKKRTSLIKKSSLGSGSSTTFTKKVRGLSHRECVASLFGTFGEVENINIAWLIDNTKSASSFVEQFKQSLAGDLALNKQTHFVFSFGQTLETINESVTELDDLRSSIESISTSTDENENAFTAITSALEAIQSTNSKQTFFVLITDEAPSDVDKLESTIEKLTDSESSLFVIGKPAPFGRSSFQNMGTDESKVDYGPESYRPQRIGLDYWANVIGMEKIDSGFGPWAYERICRTTSGRFLAVTSKSQLGWPSGSKRFKNSSQSKYAADFNKSASQIDSSISANKAMSALVKAASLSRARYSPPRMSEFMSGDEARLARDVQRIQQSVAISSLPIEELYEILKEGETDRDKLNTRWKADFDLAYGRTLAVNVRLRGANTMMGNLKQGLKFENPDNNVWVLVPNEKVDTGGTDRRMAERAKELLQGLIDEHPDTPWAYIAERELQSPLGWKWQEEKR